MSKNRMLKNITGGGRNTLYNNEREGQIAFFENFSIEYSSNTVLIDNTDGIWNGNIFEFKLSIDNLNKTLKQAIKYLSRMRLHGESVPSNIILVSLNSQKAYLYHSKDYFEDIHKVYIGASSKNNDNFVAKPFVKEYDYTKEEDTIELKNILKEKKYLPININEDCIVGWAERYYKENPKASKGDFLGDNTGKVKIIGEIREPKHFKGLINPYKGTTNEKFKYLMDKLNDRLKKKDLGAYYTPIEYCHKVAELVRIAISRVPKGNDYVIIDRCAGTGNLQSVLTDEELSHCICSTYEYYEYKVLCERLGDKLRFIIPPTESLVEYKQGLVMNADALSKDFVLNKSIQKYIKDKKCSIILLENPPYQDSSSITYTDDENKRVKVNRNDSFIKNEFKKELHLLNEQRGASRDISNLFIWSGFKYYLRQPTDSYIVFSPVKYFKSIGLVNKQMIKGFSLNRKHFHATPSAISCILWANIPAKCDRWVLETYDIIDKELIRLNDTVIKRVKKSVSAYNDKRSFSTDTRSILTCFPNGYLKDNWKPKNKYAIINENIIAYIATNGYAIDAKHRYLTRLPYYVGVEQSSGYYLRKDNYVEKLPIFCAKLYPQYEWYETDVFFTSSDMGYEYLKDKKLLRSCLIYTCLSSENKCRTIITSSGRAFNNELCFDSETIATKDLSNMKLTTEDKKILNLWHTVLKTAKAKKEYNKNFKYGLCQIETDINLFFKDDDDNKIYLYPDLNGCIVELKKRLKSYYRNNIEKLLFKYELIK